MKNNKDRVHLDALWSTKLNIEYLNRNYIDDEKLEEEVISMTKSLYDPEVEKKGLSIEEIKKLMI